METNVSQNPPFLRQRRAAMAHTSLSLLAVPPEPSLFTSTKYGIQATNTSWPAQELLVLIALASSDGSCKPKHSCCPARAFAFHIHKVWYLSYRHTLASKEILVLIAQASSNGSCKPKHSCSPTRVFVSRIHKVWK